MFFFNSCLYAVAGNYGCVNRLISGDRFGGLIFVKNRLTPENDVNLYGYNLEKIPNIYLQNAQRGV